MSRRNSPDDTLMTCLQFTGDYIIVFDSPMHGATVTYSIPPTTTTQDAISYIVRLRYIGCYSLVDLAVSWNSLHNSQFTFREMLILAEFTLYRIKNVNPVVRFTFFVNSRFFWRRWGGPFSQSFQIFCMC